MRDKIIREICEVYDGRFRKVQSISRLIPEGKNGDFRKKQRDGCGQIASAGIEELWKLKVNRCKSLRIFARKIIFQQNKNG